MELSSLINEVLKMVQESQRYDQSQQTQGKFVGAHWVPGSELDKDEEEKRKLRFADKTNSNALEIQARGGENAINLEKTKQIGTLADTGIKETGATARQRLGDISRESVADINAASRVKAAELAATGNVEAYKESAQGARDVANISLGQAGKDPVSAFIHEAIRGDPTITTDTIKDPITGKTRWQTLMENSRSLRPGFTPDIVTPEELINKYFDKRDKDLHVPLSSPNRTPIPGVAPVSTPTHVINPINPARTTLAPPKFIEDPWMVENLRRSDEERKKRANAASNFWTSIRNKFTYEPNSPNRINRY